MIPFPFKDLSGSKVRPAVVLCRSDLDVTICFITSELRWKKQYDISVFPSETNGMKVPSLIRTSKIATIDSALVLGELGELSNFETDELDKGLRGLLRLW